MKDSLRIKGLCLVSFGTLLWGVSGTVAQYLFQTEGFTTEWLVVVRMILSGMLLLSLGIVKCDKNIFKVWKDKKGIISLFIFSIVGMLGVQYTYFAAINHGNAATATILQYLSPIIITVYLALKNKKIPTAKQIICVLMALVGTFLIITKGSFNSLSISKIAVFWGICSAFAAAIYTLQPKELLRKYGSICVVGWGMLIGGSVFAFIYPPINCTGNWSIKSIFAIMFVVIFGTLIAFYCYLESLRYIQPYEASIFSCIEPLSAAVLSMVFLNVIFTPIQWLGTICIIVIITILSVKKDN